MPFAPNVEPGSSLPGGDSAQLPRVAAVPTRATSTWSSSFTGKDRVLGRKQRLVWSTSWLHCGAINNVFYFTFIPVC